MSVQARQHCVCKKPVPLHDILPEETKAKLTMFLAASLGLVPSLRIVW